MTRLFRGKLEDVKDGLDAEGMGYGISIGRRAPMHRVHVDCLHEIAQSGLVPVIVIGSTNSADSPLFDPVRNPMTVEQQKEQLRRSVPEYYNEDHILTLDDVGNDAVWMKNFEELLAQNGMLGASVMHFRAKAADAKATGPIAPLSASTKQFIAMGLGIWESFNRDPADDHVNASDIRQFDLRHLSEAQKDLMASPDYVVGLAEDARRRNPDGHLLDRANVPLTVFDLALDRLRLEANIATIDIMCAADSIDIADLSKAASAVLKQSRVTETPPRFAAAISRRAP